MKGEIMKAIITGMNGTVAPYVYMELEKRNIEIIIWDRSRVDTDSQKSVSDFIRKVQPDLFFHIATGPVKWLEFIAKATKELGVKLLFTSSVSVFSEKGSGPYDSESVPDAEEDYGSYKIQCEETARAWNPDSIILRLGWQIGSEEGSNHMVDFLAKAQKEHGFIEASSRWFPSCSFLEDTAGVIAQAALTYPPGTYLVNSNRKYSFFEIAEFLKKKHHAHWNIRETDSFERDDRMVDPRVEIPELF